MWIGSTKENNAKPLGIKWPIELIKALGVYYMYDVKLLREKNFIERLDSIKKLINIWSSRGFDNNQILSNPQICLHMCITTNTKGNVETVKSITIQILMERYRQSKTCVGDK